MKTEQEDESTPAQTTTNFSKTPRVFRRHSENPRQRRFRRGSGKKNGRQPYTKAKFEGVTEAVKDYTYDICYNQIENYTATTNAISEHIDIT